MKQSTLIFVLSRVKNQLRHLYIFAFMKPNYKTFILLVLTLSLAACRTAKDVTYFQEGNSSQLSSNVVFQNFESKDPTKSKIQVYEPVIQPNDILGIYVSSLSPEASSFFNTSSGPDLSASATTTRTSIGYLVDVNGEINMPLIGSIKVGGLPTRVACDTLTRRLNDFLQNPSVRIYFENFRVTILGEVSRPGVYTVTNEKVSLPEIIGFAGDLTIFGNRKNVMLIREIKGVKNFIKIDLTSRNLFDSPYYYLHSNDVLYIEPVNGRVAQSDNFFRVAPFVVSTITLLTVIGLRVFLNN